MKKLIYIFCLALMPFCFQACDSLDLAPVDYSGSGNYWKNEAQVEMFMIGLHNDLRAQLVENNYKLGEFRGGTVSPRGNSCGSASRYGNLIVNSISEDSPQTSNWAGFYGKILQVNILVSNLENGCTFLSDDTHNYYKGIAYGLRAYYYFWLYRLYGGVPLELEPKVAGGDFGITELYMKRATAEETLSQIKKDVEASVSAFNATTKTRNGYYFWSKNASLMLKGEVYLWSAKVHTDDPTGPHTPTGTTDLQTAKSALSEVIGKYSLAEDFATLFQHAGKRNNNEVIFSLYLDKDEYTNSDLFRRFYYHNLFNGNPMVDSEGNDVTDPLSLYGTGLINEEYKKSLVMSYDETDSRLKGTFYVYYRKSDGLFGCNMLKFFGQNDGTTHYWDPDIFLYRYADALLMMAEIENGLSGTCAAYINQIRQRAYGENYSEAVAYHDGTYAENELAILKERDKEFVGEGKRWFDLLRLQDANKEPLVFSIDAAYAAENNNGEEEPVRPVLDKATESYKLLWPIERSLMTNDPELTQTVNYPTKPLDD